MKLLVSVRTPQEAVQAAAGGATFIDLKEPGAGALGGLPVATIAAIAQALRAAGSRLPVSATVGDWRMHQRADILAQVAAVAACGVDYVKVGILAEPGAAELLTALASCGATVVPVFIADQPLDAVLVAHALALGDAPGQRRFPALMADTAEKLGGSLFDRRGDAELRAFVKPVQAAGRLVGLAGALRLPDLPRLAALAPDFAGFRSAVCDGDRAGALQPARLAQLVQAMALALQHASRAEPLVSVLP